MKASKVFAVAADLIGTDPQDVNPEYTRALIEMCAELIELDLEDDTRSMIARRIGAEAAKTADVQAATGQPTLQDLVYRANYLATRGSNDAEIDALRAALDAALRRWPLIDRTGDTHAHTLDDLNDDDICRTCGAQVNREDLQGREA